MNWVWRKDTQAQPYRRILPLVTFTLIIVCAFALAGIFSSQISTAMGNEVLLRGSNCGILSPTSDIGIGNFWGTILPYWSQRLVSSANYVQECYQNNTYVQNCPIFVRKNLQWTSKHDIRCPFPGQDKICRSNSTNLRLDTGYIDSNFDLGINSPPEYRFSYRAVVECAPLNVEGYSENITEYPKHNYTRPRQVMRYYYGNQGSHALMTYEYSADLPLQLRYHNMSTKIVISDYTIR